MARKQSVITIYSGIPFDRTYKNIIDFSEPSKLDNYLSKWPHHTMTGSYQSLDKPIRWNSKNPDTSYNELVNYNYVKIENTDPDNAKRTYYAFITSIEYLNDGTIGIYFSVDLYNTYRRRVRFPNAFIQRGFVRDWNANHDGFTEDFERIKNNDEPIGGDGATQLISSSSVDFHRINKDNNGNDVTKELHYLGDEQVKTIVFTVQPKDATTEAGSMVGAYTQYRYYILAYDPTNLKCYNIKHDGTMITDLQGKTISEVYQELSKNEDLVGSSSLVVDSEIYNYNGLYFWCDLKGNALDFKDKTIQLEKAHSYLTWIKSAGYGDFEPEHGYARVTDKATQPALGRQLYDLFAERYGTEFPAKIMFKPYSKLYFTDGRGVAGDFDIGYFTRLDQMGVGIYRFGGFTENGKEQYSVLHYNRASTSDKDIPVVYENAQLVDDGARDVPIVLDSYTEYINANRNQLRNTRANAKMNMQLSKQGNNIGLANAQNSMEAGRNAQVYTQGRNQQMATIKGAMGGFNSGVGAGGLIGGVFGAAGGALMGNAMTRYDNNTALNSADIQRNAQMQNLERNNAFSNEVATNNYEQTIRSQNAQLADTKNHNDQIAHLGSSFLYDFQNQNFRLHMQVFTSQDSVIKNAILYFSLFGYTINQWGPLEQYMKVKKIFNYVKASDVTITGMVNEEVKRFYEGLFENGVTFWSEDHVEQFEGRDITGNSWL